MGSILDVILSVSFIHAIFRVTTPILFTAMGALIAKKAGVMNIGLEGIMLFGALSGVVFSSVTHSSFLGVIGAGAVGVLLGLLLGYCALKLKTDIFLAGIALNLLGSGGTVFILYVLTGEKGMSGSVKSMTVPNINLDLLDNLPMIGDILNNQSVLTYLAFLLVPLMYIFIYRTSLGLRIRAVGESQSSAESVGIKAKKIQYIALGMSGFLAAVGGTFLSMSYVSWFSRDMTAGRGFIALAAEAMGNSHPVGVLLSSLLFGTADALASNLQALELPIEFLQMLPYLATIVGMLIFSIRKAKKRKTKKRMN